MKERRHIPPVSIFPDRFKSELKYALLKKFKLFCYIHRFLKNPGGFTAARGKMLN